MSDPNYKLMDALQELEFAIKAHHGVTYLLAGSDEINENVYYAFNGIGDKLQSTFSEVEKMIKAISS
jgi:hypothetical protein